MYQLQFFSRPSDEGDAPTQAEFGYDGSCSVEHFSETAIQSYLTSMDCIYGECLIIVSWPNPHDTTRTLRSAYRTVRVSDY